MNTVTDIIESLGGTSQVAQLCEIKPSSVSEWKANNHIPKARLQYLALVRPDIDWSALRDNGARRHDRAA